MEYRLSEDQRLIAYTVVSNQRGSLAEQRLNNQLLDALDLDDEALRRAVGEARMQHILRPVADALYDTGTGQKDVAITEVQAERLARLLNSWDNYAAADAMPVTGMLEVLGKPHPPVLKRQANYALFLTLHARLQLTLFIKQITGSLSDAQTWAAIVMPLGLTDEEVQRIRFRSTSNGQASWITGPLKDEALTTVSLTETEAGLLLKRMQTHEGWTPADLKWLANVLEQLEAPVTVRERT